MANTPFSSGSSNAALTSTAHIGPGQGVGPDHDGAPAGLVPSEAELPIVSSPGGSQANLGGFSANGAQDALPPAGSTEGSGLAPSGTRK